MKRSTLFNLFFCILAFIVVERLCRLQTSGFRYTKAVSAHSYPMTYLEDQIPKELSQAFTFLGSGVQFYAFLGEDQKTVLKLFKHHHMGLSTDLIKKLLPTRFSTPLVLKREKRMEHILNSAKIAASELREETGILFLHIGKTSKRLGKTTIFDPLGIAHPLDLDKTDFVLQKRALSTQQYLEELFGKGATKEAFSKMEEIIAMIVSRSEKGIKNKDGNVLENCGFIDDKPIELDIGSYIYRTQSANPNPHAKAAMRASLQLLGWVKKYHPKELNSCTERLLYETPY